MGKPPQSEKRKERRTLLDDRKSGLRGRQASGGGVGTSLTGETGRSGTGVSNESGKGRGTVREATGGSIATNGIGIAVCAEPPHVFMLGTFAAFSGWCSQIGQRQSSESLCLQQHAASCAAAATGTPTWNASAKAASQPRRRVNGRRRCITAW